MNQIAPRRIAFFIPTLAQGGGERVVSTLSLHFQKSVLCFLIVFEKNISYSFSGEIISLNVPLSQNPIKRAGRFWVRLWRFRRLIADSRFDTVISVGSSSNLINVLVNRSKAVLRADLPPSWSTPGFWGWLYRAAARLLFRRARHIVAVSHFIKDDLQQNYGVAKQRIRVIPNPVDREHILELAQAQIPAEFEYIFQGPVVATMGRLTYQKGHRHLLCAFAEARKQASNARLMVLGEGELRGELEELRYALGLDDWVYFLGWQKNPFSLLARSEVFALSSLWEGLPDAMLEAMACGLPIISTDCRSGPREILAPGTDFQVQTEYIENAEYGILVPVSDEDALAKALARVLTDSNLRKALSQKSTARAAHYGVSAVIPQWKFLWSG